MNLPDVRTLASLRTQSQGTDITLGRYPGSPGYGCWGDGPLLHLPNTQASSQRAHGVPTAERIAGTGPPRIGTDPGQIPSYSPLAGARIQDVIGDQ